MEFKSTKEIANTYIKVLVHGGAGAGKTRLCATVKNPIILSAEGGLLSLADEDIPVVEIKSIEDLMEAYSFLKSDTKFDWICIDSISEISEVLLSAEKDKTNDPRKAYGETQERMMKLMRSFRDLDKNIYFSAKQVRIKDEVTGGLVYGPSAIGQKLGPAMPYLFDEVFALHTWKDEDGIVQRALQTTKDAQYEAKDRSGKLEHIEPADLGKIYDKIKGEK